MVSKKRIVIVDDHTLFRKGLKAIIGNDNGFEVTGEAGSKGRDCGSANLLVGS